MGENMGALQSYEYAMKTMGSRNEGITAGTLHCHDIERKV